MSDPAVEVLDEAQCQMLLGSRDLGRIAFSVDDQPELFPVNYAADGSIIIFRTAEGSRLQAAAMRKVAFEVDDWDPSAAAGWSVVVKGVAAAIGEGIDPFTMALRSRKVVPLAPGAREYWMAIYPSEITGRRFRR
jgi:nitroimidazol reductase NimA-like FMN-containing flavoprotein (pyridoxamine 5'-phosphate oxidase superfamily)